MPDDDSNQPRLITVALKDVKPNPFRDLPNYKLNDDKVEALMASINSTGFWANVIGRLNPAGEFEIAYGHHRVEAARRVLGPDHTHTFPAYPLSDTVMIRMMADENSDAWSNQVGHTNLVVGVARDFLDKLLDKYETLEQLKGGGEFASVAALFQTNSQYEQIRRDGVGRSLIQAFLSGTYADGHRVRDALEHLPLSPKQRAAKEREDADARSRAAEIKAEEERQRVEREAEEQIARAAAEHAKAERQAAEAERKRLAEETKRTNAWLKKMRDNEVKAKAAADAAASKRVEADRKAAEVAQKLAEEAEARAEAKRKEAEEAEARLMAQHDAEAKARQQRLEEIQAEIERLEKKEAQITARLAQDGLYDIRAGELFGKPAHAKAFREVVTSDRAVKAGIRVEAQYMLAQEILRAYKPRINDGSHGILADDALTARTIKQHIMRLVMEAEGIAWKQKERRDKLETTFEKLNKSLNASLAAMTHILGHLKELGVDALHGMPVSEMYSALKLLDHTRKRLDEAIRGRSPSTKPAPTLIPAGNDK
jgi:chemotaxis protein histidine kinase CheA